MPTHITCMSPPTHAAACCMHRYMCLSLPALYLHVLHECLDKYLLAQRVVKPGVIITIATTMLMPVFCYVLIPMYVLIGSQRVEGFTATVLCYSHLAGRQNGGSSMPAGLGRLPHPPTHPPTCPGALWTCGDVHLILVTCYLLCVD